MLMSLLVRYTFTLFALLACLPGLAFDQFEPFSEDGKFGLINAETREVVIAPEYEAIGWSLGEFKVYDGTIAVKRNNKWALASVGGELITQPLYTVLYPFVDGLLVAAERSQFSILNQYGLINSKGKTTLKLDYDQLTPNGQQVIIGKLSQGKYQYGLITKTGKEIIPVSHPAITPVISNLYAVMASDGLSALFSSTGQQLSPFEFESIEAFDEKRLLIKYYNRKGLVDLYGKVIVSPIYKDVRLESGKLRALPFKKWTLWAEDHSSRDYFFDQMLPLNQNRFAVQANENLGIIDQNEDYMAYFEKLRLVEAKHDLLVVSNGTYAGVINAEGRMILPVNYDDVMVIEQCIMAKINRPNGHGWEVFDRTGKLVSRQRYQSFEPLASGLIKARKNGKSGLLDMRGREQSPFIYDAMSDFENSMAVVKYLGNQGVIHENGNWVITPYKDSLVRYKDFIWYRYGSENGILDLNEKVRFRTQNDILPVNKDLLISNEDEDYEILDGYGTPLTDQPFDSVQVVHNNLLVVSKNERISFFNPFSKKLNSLPDHTEAIGSYSEDLVSAQIDGQWGFVKEDGSLAIANRYEAVKPFSEGLASVKLIGKWGVIDKQERIVIQPSYDSIGAFYGGLALIQRDELFGLMDRAGNNVLDLQYEALEINPKFILLKSGGLYGLADARGRLVRTPQYDRISPLGNGLFLLQRDGKSGVINLNGEDLVPLAYDQVIELAGGFLAAEPSNWISPAKK